MKVRSYEAKGKEYSALEILTPGDVQEAVALFRNETDPWLRKIIATKLSQAAEQFPIPIPESELAEARSCRISL